MLEEIKVFEASHYYITVLFNITMWMNLLASDPGRDFDYHDA